MVRQSGHQCRKNKLVCRLLIGEPGDVVPLPIDLADVVADDGCYKGQVLALCENLGLVLDTAETAKKKGAAGGDFAGNNAVADVKGFLKRYSVSAAVPTAVWLDRYAGLLRCEEAWRLWKGCERPSDLWDRSAAALRAAVLENAAYRHLFCGQEVATACMTNDQRVAERRAGSPSEDPQRSHLVDTLDGAQKCRAGVCRDSSEQEKGPPLRRVGIAETRENFDHPGVKHVKGFEQLASLLQRVPTGDVFEREVADKDAVFVSVDIARANFTAFSTFCLAERCSWAEYVAVHVASLSPDESRLLSLSKKLRQHVFDETADPRRLHDKYAQMLSRALSGVAWCIEETGPQSSAVLAWIPEDGAGTQGAQGSEGSVFGELFRVNKDEAIVRFKGGRTAALARAFQFADAVQLAIDSVSLLSDNGDGNQRAEGSPPLDPRSADAKEMTIFSEEAKQDAEARKSQLLDNSKAECNGRPTSNGNQDAEDAVPVLGSRQPPPRPEDIRIEVFDVAFPCDGGAEAGPAVKHMCIKRVLTRSAGTVAAAGLAPKSVPREVLPQVLRYLQHAGHSTSASSTPHCDEGQEKQTCPVLGDLLADTDADLFFQMQPEDILVRFAQSLPLHSLACCSADSTRRNDSDDSTGSTCSCLTPAVVQSRAVREPHATDRRKVHGLKAAVQHTDPFENEVGLSVKSVAKPQKLMEAEVWLATWTASHSKKQPLAGEGRPEIPLTRIGIAYQSLFNTPLAKVFQAAGYGKLRAFLEGAATVEVKNAGHDAICIAIPMPRWERSLELSGVMSVADTSAKARKIDRGTRAQKPVRERGPSDS
ncbi:hypothetical protein DIPPA_05376 [Diplonema papillatum]|nr:hypothetical protein DIPPA_05376 [Diplonema papillatum]